MFPQLTLPTTMPSTSNSLQSGKLLCQLPPETLAGLYDYLSCRDDIRNLALTCKVIYNCMSKEETHRLWALQY